MSEEIIKVLDDLARRFGIAIDWSSENVVPYLEELFGKFINYELWTSVMWLVLGLALVVIGVTVIYKTFNVCEDVDILAAVSAIMLIFILSGIFMVVHQATDIITCMTFPEKMLLESIQGYLR